MEVVKWGWVRRNLRHTINSTANARCGAWFVTERDWNASSTRKLLPLDVTSLVNDHTDIGFGGRDGDGSCITGSVDSQISIFDDVSCIKAICELVLLCVSFIGISVTKLTNRIIRQCVCKGRMGRSSVLDSKSSWLTKNNLDMVLPVTDKWYSKT
jgi:hypothetical protein